MNETPVTHPRPGPRWLNPRSMGGTVLLFVLGYAVWQPLAQVLLHAVSGDAWPFTTRAEWVRFAVVAGAVGAFAGAAWHRVRRMRAGWWRDWGDSALRMLALTMVLQAQRFAPADVRWWAALLGASVMTGTLLAAVVHVVRGRGKGQRPAPSLGSTVGDER